MIKSAIEKIVELSGPKVTVINNKHYSDKILCPVKDPCPDSIQSSTLSSIVDYYKANIDALELKNVMIHIQSPTSVCIVSHLTGNFYQRDTFMHAQLKWPPSCGGSYMDLETTIVTLQTHFVRTDALTHLLSIIGNIKEEAIRTNLDDGVSQTVTVKSGVSLAKNVDIPNPIKLKPYRTFIEIDQPESLYLFRMRKGPECAIMEADGGMWKIEAITRIKEFFKNELPDVIVLA